MVTERLLVDLRSDGRVQVSSWPAGEQFPRPVGEPVQLVWPLSDEDLADLRWYLERYLRLPTAVYGERGARVAAALPKWGQQIFTAVFGSGPARDAYVAARVRGGSMEIALLSSSAEQLGRPWELMSDPGRGVPVVLDGVTVSRSLQTPGMAEVFAVAGERLRVLMVISRPEGTADVDYQMIARPLLQRLEAVRGSVELVVLRPPTLDRLGKVLAGAREAGEPFQVVHFDGHGVFGPAPALKAGSACGSDMYQARGPLGMLAFEKPGGGSDLVEAGRVARVLAGARVPVVVLNACQSAQVGSQVEATVATRLLTEGCASVVAMAYSVYAVAAAEFMTAFYERLFAGDRVTDAVTAGRGQLALNDRRPSMKGMLPLADWMVPVLYTRSEVRFPKLRTTRRPDEAVGEILARFRTESRDGPASGQGEDLEPAYRLFVGRDADFYTLDVAARLQRVVVVHGPGGTGKTELAKAFGRWWRDTGGVGHPDWVIWHSFEPGVASFGLDGVITRIGSQVFDTDFEMLDADRRRTAVEELLRTRRLLLVWDNFESVREMPDPGRATPPLPQDEQDRIRAFLTRIADDSRSAVVITSRSPEGWLGPGIRRIGLGGLNSEDSALYAEHLLAPYPSAHPRRQTPAFADLMQWLDGHPLSMRLTLPHLDTTTAQQLLAGLQGTSAFPADHGSGDRRTSLAASIAYSFQHLSPADQQALTILSLFHGVAFAPALAVFSEQSETPERFQGCTVVQWVAMMERAANLGLLTPVSTGAYRLHPALPAHLTAQWHTHSPDTHASEQASAINALIVAHVFVSHWLNGEISGGDAQLGFNLIGIQQRMLGTMLGHTLEGSRWADAKVILAALDAYWRARGLVNEARSWLDRVRLAVEAPDGAPPAMGSPAAALWVFAAVSQGELYFRAGQLDDAENTYRAVLRSQLQQPDVLGSDWTLALAYRRLGNVANERGRLGEAEEWYRRALTIDEEDGNRPGMAADYHQLGTVAEELEQWDEAKEWYRRALTIDEEDGNRPGMATVYHQLGTVAQRRERVEEAEGWYRRSLAIHEELGDRPGIAGSYYQLGMIAEDREQWDEAEEWYRRALTIQEQLGDRLGTAKSYRQLGMVADSRSRFEEAEEWYRHSLAISEELGDQSGMASSCHQLGLVAQHRYGWQEAEEWYRRSLAISEELGDRPRLASTYHQLGVVAQIMTRLAEAEKWYRRSLAIYEELGDRLNMDSGSYLLGVVVRRLGRFEQAEEWYRQSLTIRQEKDDRPGVAGTYCQLGVVAQNRERWQEAESRYRRALAIYEEMGSQPGIASAYMHLGLLAEAQANLRQALTWTPFDEAPDPSPEIDSDRLRRLTAQLGVHVLERTWKDVTGKSLPANVRDYVLTDPADAD
ncbi:tetratricopeptide repeat protein [Streptomyces phaeochromogenes]|uniref:CHAT domain-containing tetratricopeptide repeat protein n=1 Tax=Streptomyces phaeochromogenes TaxID=1923 RepID=UPI0038649595|nr:tetratricopeptide repeat protein [Streptomyces phaeochromogenes]